MAHGAPLEVEARRAHQPARAASHPCVPPRAVQTASEGPRCHTCRLAGRPVLWRKGAISLGSPGGALATQHRVHRWRTVVPRLPFRPLSEEHVGPPVEREASATASVGATGCLVRDRGGRFRRVGSLAADGPVDTTSRGLGTAGVAPPGLGRRPRGARARASRSLASKGEAAHLGPRPSSWEPRRPMPAGRAAIFSSPWLARSGCPSSRALGSRPPRSGEAAPPRSTSPWSMPIGYGVGPAGPRFSALRFVFKKLRPTSVWPVSRGTPASTFSSGRWLRGPDVEFPGS